MTTPTTNFGWLKPTAVEKANITVVNTLMDDADTDMKTVETTNATKIYPMGEYRIMREISVTGGGDIYRLVDINNPMWENTWYASGNVGGWTFPGSGYLTFTTPGIYRVIYNFTLSTYGSSTTSGYASIGIYKRSDNSYVPRSKTYIRSNTTDYINNFQRTTLTGTFYIWSGTGTDQCLLNTDYYFGLQQHTTAGTIQMIFNPGDLGVFRSQLTIECVRTLAS